MTIMRSHVDDAGSLCVVAAAFVLGAGATWLAHAALDRKRASGPVADNILAQRVRARIGELASRPDAIAVQVEQGVVRLSGEAPAGERQSLLSSLVDMPGVARVRSALGTLRDSN